MPSIIKTPLPKKKRRTLNEAQRTVVAQAQATKAELDKLPKFGDKYGKPKKPVSKVSHQRALEAQRLAERLASARSTPSLKTTESHTGKVLPQRYDGELAKREKKARERKFAVAPAYNKGGLQLITDEADYKTMGRKI